MADARSDEHDVAGGVGDAVGAGDGVRDGVGEGDGVREGDGAADGLRDGDAEGDPDGDAVGVGVAAAIGIVRAVPPDPLHCASPTLSAVSATNPSMETFARDRRGTARRRTRVNSERMTLPLEVAAYARSVAPAAPRQHGGQPYFLRFGLGAATFRKEKGAAPSDALLIG
jgi:hypothetical protein